jgi:folate-binding protein YgfZ
LALLGTRWILPAGETPPATNGTPIDYKAWRLLLGIAETEGLVPHKTLPFDALFHKLNALSMEKGCYLGQELIARTLHRGTVRRHFFPLTFGGKRTPITGEVVHFNQEPVGKIITSYKNIALAKLSVEAAVAAWDAQAPLQADSVELTPHIWSWMAMETRRPTPHRPLDDPMHLSLA